MKIKNTVLTWLLTDLIHPYMNGLLRNTFFNALSILSQLAAFALLYKFVNKIESNESWVILDKEYSSEPTFATLLLISFLIGFMFIVSGYLKYYSKIGALNMARRYEETCSSRLLAKIGDCQNIAQLFSIEGNKVNEKSIKRSLVKDTRSCGKVVLLINHSITVFGKLLLSMLFMLYIHFTISLIIVLLAFPMLLFLRKESRKVVTLTRKRESLITKFIANRRTFLRDVITNKSSSIDRNKTVDDEFYDVYYSILKKLALTDLAMILFIAVIAITIIMAAGNLVLLGNMNWSVFIAYVIALRFFFVSLQGVGGIIKKSSKFYEYIDHYISLLSSFTTSNQASFEVVANIKLTEEYMDDDDDDDDDEI